VATNQVAAHGETPVGLATHLVNQSAIDKSSTERLGNRPHRKAIWQQAAFQFS
jgi:hypothetical protein